MNAQTRERVLKAAMEVGYVPNQSGRSLRKGTTSTVGLILTQGNSLGENNDNFFFGVIRGLQAALKKHKLDLVLPLCSRDEDPGSFLQRMVAQRIVDLVILTATRTHDERFNILRRANTPFVTLGRSDSLGDASWIDLDFEGIAEQANQIKAAGGEPVSGDLMEMAEDDLSVPLKAAMPSCSRQGRPEAGSREPRPLMATGRKRRRKRPKGSVSPGFISSRPFRKPVAGASAMTGSSIT